MNSQPEAVKSPGTDLAADTVSIPTSLLLKMSEAAQAFETFQGELEDYLLSQDNGFVARMRQARAHHLNGETRSLDLLKRELCIE